MLLSARPGAIGCYRSLRFVLLIAASLLVAHDGVYAAQYGVGARLAARMSASGHDGIYWPLFSVLGATGAVALGLLAARELLLLSRKVGALDSRSDPQRTAAPGYWRELANLWPRLFLLVTPLFVLQENVEHVLSHGHVIGIGALTGPEYPLALPVLVVVTLLLAALGGLVRWRVAILRERLAAAHRAPREPTSAPRPVTTAWSIVAAEIAHRWILVRHDHGRAPPLSVV